ncbi:MAG: hypothetical protein GY948_04695 [Alphaproteobacteria bacterium]|nr:hypothetical protein [Alphaproteobacteria bacterium]
MLTRSLKAIHQWLVQRQEDKFLNGFNNSELMDDVVQRSEFLSALDAPKETSSLMARMAAKQGLRPDVVANNNRRTLLMAGACSRCRHRTLCKRWLDGRAKKAKAERFCVNAHHFDDLKKQTITAPDPGPGPLPGAGGRLERRLN